MKRQQILLDMDGVLVDFLSGAIKALNRDFNKDYTIEQYAEKFGRWETYDFYGITAEQFWQSIENTPYFWIDLKPMPWYMELYSFLSELGDVTIITSPSLDPVCAMDKLRWLKANMNIGSDKVFLGSRKYLMAGNGILIDDYYKNVENFKSAGGEAILIPSTWNTNGLTFERIKNTILNRS
jgi:5'(3')-deoxyribonucleotidase